MIVWLQRFAGTWTVMYSGRTRIDQVGTEDGDGEGDANEAGP